MKGIYKPTLDKICSTMNKLYPLKNADSSWDNVGLLIDCSKNLKNESDAKNKILLTVDLTEKVCNEAIKKEINLIIAYHPFLFKKINKIEKDKFVQHKSLIKLIQNGISVYSPHTSVDAAIGGVNDWICDSISGGINNESKRKSIINNDSSNELIGFGRVLELKKSITLTELVDRVKKMSGQSRVQLVRNPCTVVEDAAAPLQHVTTVAVCAGSGASVFASLDAPVDAVVVGELSHHEQLSLAGDGHVTCGLVICGHCNSERGFLKERMLPSLTIEKDEGDLEMEVIVSETDGCPYELV